MARKSLAWVKLEEREAQMKARLMYKTVNGLAPQRLCEAFQGVNTIHDYNLRGFSTKFYIPKPKAKFLKKVSDIVDLNYGIRYQRKYEIWYGINRFVVKSFPPRP